MIFVSGGTGFIGSHSVRRLAKAGHKLRLLTYRGSDPASNLPREQSEYVTGEITNPESLKGKMDGCEVAINFVGIIVQTGNATFDRIHVEGVGNLLGEAKRAGVSRFIHISALGTSMPPASEYFRTKLFAEQLIKESGIPYVILRPSLVFGPEDKFFNTLRPMLRAPIVPVIGDGKTQFQPIWVEDIASCIVKSVENKKPLNGVWEIGGPEVMTFDELLDQMAGALNLQPRMKFHIPITLVKPFARLMETVLRRPPLTTDQLRMLSIDNVTKSNAITEVFGVKPRSFRNAAAEYWKK